MLGRHEVLRLSGLLLLTDSGITGCYSLLSPHVGTWCFCLPSLRLNVASALIPAFPAAVLLLPTCTAHDFPYTCHVVCQVPSPSVALLFLSCCCVPPLAAAHLPCLGFPVLPWLGQVSSAVRVTVLLLPCCLLLVCCDVGVPIVGVVSVHIGVQLVL